MRDRGGAFDQHSETHRAQPRETLRERTTRMCKELEQGAWKVQQGTIA